MQVQAPTLPLEEYGIQQRSASTHRSPGTTSGGGAGGYHIEPLCHTVPLQASDLEHLDSAAGSTNSSLLWQSEPVLAGVRALPSASHPESRDPTGSAGERLLCQQIEV